MFLTGSSNLKGQLPRLVIGHAESATTDGGAELIALQSTAARNVLAPQ
jgi:hypothetical protein